MNILNTSSIEFSYENKAVLQNINLALEPGTFTALLGPNGAGKSTLFHLLCNLLTPHSGEISINNLPLKKMPRKALAEMGIVFQQSTLDPDLTVKQNLEYHAALHGLRHNIRNRRIREELLRMQMQERANEKVRDLNGGHRRRVEIARALLHSPKLLLLDEATVGLDPQTRTGINAYVRKLCSENNLTVLWSTHLIEEITQSDRVVILHQGKIITDAISRLEIEHRESTRLEDYFARLTDRVKQ